MTDENLDTLQAAIQAFDCRDFDVALHVLVRHHYSDKPAVRTASGTLS